MSKQKLLSTAAAREFRADVLQSAKYKQMVDNADAFYTASECMVANDPDGKMGIVLVLDSPHAGRMMAIPMDRKLLKEIKQQYERAERSRREGYGVDLEDFEMKPDFSTILNPTYRKDYPLQPFISSSE